MQINYHHPVSAHYFISGLERLFSCWSKVPASYRTFSKCTFIWFYSLYYFTTILLQILWLCPEGDATVRSVCVFLLLTVIGVVADDMVPPAPVPQQQRGVPGPGHDVAVSSDVRLWSGQTCHHVPVAEHDLRQLAYRKYGQNVLERKVPEMIKLKLQGVIV